MQGLDLFINAPKMIPDRIAKAKASGTKVFAIIPAYYAPYEIIEAAGALALGVIGNTGPTNTADAHIQSFTCSVVRTSLQMALDGKLSGVDAVLFPSVCDAVQNLSDIYDNVIGKARWLNFIYPIERSAKLAPTLMKRTVAGLIAAVEEVTGNKITAAKLNAAITTHNETRRLIGKLYELRRAGAIGLTPGEFAAVVNASIFMPKAEYNTALTGLLATLKPDTMVAKKRIFVSGILPEPPEVVDLIEKDGTARVVDDDFAVGTRMYERLVSEDTAIDPVERIVSALSKPSPCSTIIDRSQSRVDYLLDRIAAARADGVIMLVMKFCEPEQFDYPEIKKALEAKGIPHLMLEFEGNTSSFDNLGLRIAAFVELLA